MNRLLDWIIGINIAGLVTITALESWRPGLISTGINIGLMWIVAVTLISLGLLMKNSTEPTK